MTPGEKKAYVIRSVAGSLKDAAMPKLDEDAKEILAAQVGFLLDKGYDLGDIRYAACEIALAGDKTWSLCKRVMEEFDCESRGVRVTLPFARLPAVPVKKDGEAHGTHLTKTDSTTRRAQSAEAGGAHAR